MDLLNDYAYGDYAQSVHLYTRYICAVPNSQSTIRMSDIGTIYRVDTCLLPRCVSLSVHGLSFNHD